MSLGTKVSTSDDQNQLPARQKGSAGSQFTRHVVSFPFATTQKVGGGGGTVLKWTLKKRRNPEHRGSQKSNLPVLHMLKYVCMNQLFQFIRYAGTYGHCMPSYWRSDHKAKICSCYSHYGADLRTCTWKQRPAAEKAHTETVHKKCRRHLGAVNKTLKSKDSCRRCALRRSRIVHGAPSAVLFSVKNTERFVI